MKLDILLIISYLSALLFLFVGITIIQDYDVSSKVENILKILLLIDGIILFISAITFLVFMSHKDDDKYISIERYI